MKMYSEDKKRFNKPELEIVWFEGDLATDVISSSGTFDDPDPKQGDINGWWN